jgi:hypothetical protein
MTTTDNDRIGAISAAMYGSSSPRHDAVATEVSAALRKDGWTLSHCTDSNLAGALYVAERDCARARNECDAAVQARDVAQVQADTERALRMGALR